MLTREAANAAYRLIEQDVIRDTGFVPSRMGGGLLLNADVALNPKQHKKYRRYYGPQVVGPKGIY